jgi:formylglycine-generating enzyme required for sulfatase activity
MRALRLAPFALWFLPLASGWASDARAPGSVFRDCDDCPEMVVVPAGVFVMGTPSAMRRPGIAAAESDAVAMEIPRAFALGRQEVTRREYAVFIAKSGYESRSGCRTWDPALGRFSKNPRTSWRDPATPAVPAGEHPVTCVSFIDAQAYVQWLSRETGARYRLPSEAEWEYAARADSASLRPWGDDADAGCEQANTYDVTADAALRLGWANAGCRDGYADVAPAGQFAANAFGLHDLIGNVREWVQDCATASYAGRPRDARAWEWLGGCGQRVQRGGSWLSPPDEARSAARFAADAEDRGDDAGFRVAMEIGTSRER